VPYDAGPGDDGKRQDGNAQGLFGAGDGPDPQGSSIEEKTTGEVEAGAVPRAVVEDAWMKDYGND